MFLRSCIVVSRTATSAEERLAELSAIAQSCCAPVGRASGRFCKHMRPGASQALHQSLSVLLQNPEVIGFQESTSSPEPEVVAHSPNPGPIFLTLAVASVFAGPLFPFVALTLPIWAQALSGGRRQDRRQPSSRVRSGSSRQQQQQRGFGFSLPDDEPQYERRWALLLWAARCTSSLCT